MKTQNQVVLQNHHLNRKFAKAQENLRVVGLKSMIYLSICLYGVLILLMSYNRSSKRIKSKWKLRSIKLNLSCILLVNAFIIAYAITYHVPWHVMLVDMQLQKLKYVAYSLKRLLLFVNHNNIVSNAFVAIMIVYMKFSIFQINKFLSLHWLIVSASL